MYALNARASTPTAGNLALVFDVLRDAVGSGTLPARLRKTGGSVFSYAPSGTDRSRAGDLTRQFTVRDGATPIGTLTLMVFDDPGGVGSSVQWSPTVQGVVHTLGG